MSKEDKKIIIIFILTYAIFYGVIIIGLANKEIHEQNYIQNLEEKLNIYERSYEEFCLEDSLKQSDVYGQ